MKTSKADRTPWLLVLLLPLVLGGCRREPWGGCPYEDIEVAPDFVTPWGTTLEQDLAQLAGPHRGILAWRDGEDIIMVPKAGQELPVEAIVEIDPATASMRRYESTSQTPVCEADTLSMDATITFVRLDDEGVELSTSAVVARDTDTTRYHGEVEDMSVVELSPDLIPLEDFQTEEVRARIGWGEDGSFCAAYDYHGSSRDDSSGSSTGHGVSQLVAEFIMPAAGVTCS